MPGHAASSSGIAKAVAVAAMMPMVLSLDVANVGAGNVAVTALGTVSAAAWYLTSTVASVQVLKKVPELVEVGSQASVCEL